MSTHITCVFQPLGLPSHTLLLIRSSLAAKTAGHLVPHISLTAIPKNQLTGSSIYIWTSTCGQGGRRATYLTRESLQRCDVSARLGISSKPCEGRGSPFNRQCLTNHAALNSMACMCQTICYVTSSLVWAERVGQGKVGWYTYCYKGL